MTHPFDHYLDVLNQIFEKLLRNLIKKVALMCLLLTIDNDLVVLLEVLCELGLKEYFFQHRGKYLRKNLGRKVSNF